MIRILIVEPQTAEQLTAETLTTAHNSLPQIISGQPGMEAAGVTDNLSKARRLCGELMPDMLLIDMTKGNNAITETARIRREFPDIKIVIWTSLPYNIFADKARNAHIHSFIDKNTGNENLLSAIHFTMQDKGMYCRHFE